MASVNIEKVIAVSNFRQAREMLCIKLGWEREFQKYIRCPDSDVNKKEIAEFIRRTTRILAFNYDVHRCPNPSLFPTLWPEHKEGSQPLRFPPEYQHLQSQN